jgi:hypothetical protein
MKSKLIILIAFILFSPVHSYPVTAKSEELESTSYFPPAEQQNLPPRKNITLSIFAASGTLESYEKNLDSNGIPILVEGSTHLIFVGMRYM